MAGDGSNPSSSRRTRRTVARRSSASTWRPRAYNNRATLAHSGSSYGRWATSGSTTLSSSAVRPDAIAPAVATGTSLNRSPSARAVNTPTYGAEPAPVSTGPRQRPNAAIARSQQRSSSPAACAAAASDAHRSNTTRSTSPGSIRSRYPPGSVSIASVSPMLESARRICEMCTCRLARTVEGGSSPHTESIKPSADAG